MTYATEEERIAARRNTWARYNRAHKAERCQHNKAHVQKDYVKARRRERYAERMGIKLKQTLALIECQHHQSDGTSFGQAENNNLSEHAPPSRINNDNTTLVN